MSDIISKEFNEEFVHRMKHAVAMSFFKYGPARINFGSGRVDAVKTAEACLEAFKKDHNTEHLIDVANYCMFGYTYPESIGGHYIPTDDSGSVKPVGTPVNMDREEVNEREYTV